MTTPPRATEDQPDEGAGGSDAQQREWDTFVAEQHAKGRCEHSGRRVSQCVRTICDCFETPEGAAEIERKANGHVCAECPDCIHNGAKCCGCYDGVCCKEGDPR